MSTLFLSLVSGLGVLRGNPDPVYRDIREQRIGELADVYVSSPSRYRIDTSVWTCEGDPSRILTQLFYLDLDVYRAAVGLVAFEDYVAEKEQAAPDVTVRYVQTSPRLLSLQRWALAGYSPGKILRP
jgi:hypothetical protein